MITSWVRVTWAIRISGYPLLKFSDFFRIFGSCSFNFQAIVLKLGVNDHHMSVDVLGYPDICFLNFRIFSDFRPLWPQFQSYYAQTWCEWSSHGCRCFRQFGYPDIRIRIFRIFGPQSHILRARTLKLCMNDHLMNADDFGHTDIRISTSGFFGYLPPTAAI